MKHIITGGLMLSLVCSMHAMESKIETKLLHDVERKVIAYEIHKLGIDAMRKKVDKDIVIIEQSFNKKDLCCTKKDCMINKLIKEIVRYIEQEEEKNKKSSSDDQPKNSIESYKPLCGNTSYAKKSEKNNIIYSINLQLTNKNELLAILDLHTKNHDINNLI